MQDCSVIAKGSYSNFRFNDFVSVRQYLLIREKGEKYLIMKLSNDAKETVTGLKLVVEQLDVRGSRIETSHVEWNDVKGKPGQKFIPQNKIHLRENCVEVKIRLVGATYGDYTYSVKSNELVVTYHKPQEKLRQDYSYQTGGKDAVIEERKFKIPMAIIAMTLFVLLCVMVATALQLFKFKKEETIFTLNNVKYEFVSEDKKEGAPVRVIGNAGFGRDIVIPAEIEGYPVAEIASNSFRNNDYIHSVRIEAPVPINDFTFSDCDNLVSVEISGPDTIGKQAFSNCKKLENVVGEDVEQIGEKAFYACAKLKSITFTSEDEELQIDSKAFDSCNGLKTIELNQIVRYPDTIDFFGGVKNVNTLKLKNFNSATYETKTTKVLSDLFSGNTQVGLRSLSIEDIDEIPVGFCSKSTELQSVSLSGLKSTEIKDRAFSECENLAEFNFEFEEDNTYFTGVGGYAFYKTKIAEFNGFKLKSIGDFAFAENSALRSVNLENNDALTRIGSAAFKDCTALKSINVPQKIETIENSTFENCMQLTTVTFSDQSVLSHIGEKAMCNCINLSFIKIPNSVLSIGASAFSECSSMSTVVVSRALQSVGEMAFAGCESIKEIDFPTTVTEIGVGALQECSNLQNLTVPFIGCSYSEKTYLASIFGGSSYESFAVVPETLKTVTVTGSGDIDDYAFYAISSIKQVFLNGQVQYIGQSAFAYCLNLREIHLSNNLDNVGYGAFDYCYNLFEVWNNSSLPISCGSSDYGSIGRYALAVYNSEDERLENKTVDGFFFLNAPQGWHLTDYIWEDTEWVLPSSFTDKDGNTVSEYVMTQHLFEMRKDVVELTVSAGVKSMAQYAFAYCPNLESVTYASDVSLNIIENNVFLNCTSLLTVNMDKSANITEIKEYAFYDCTSLKTVLLSGNLLHIRDNAFYNCYSLVDIVLPAQLSSIGTYAFANCTSLKELNIPESVASIGQYALLNASKLATLTVPYIGGSASNNCYMGYILDGNTYSGNYSLKQITVLSSTDIPSNAFYGFEMLEKLTLNGTALVIGEYAFYNCSNLESISCSGVVQEICAYAFAYSGIESFDFEEGLTSIGEYAFQSTPIKNAVFPSTLSNMGTSAFRNSSIKTVDLSNVCMTEIPSYAFASCSNLTTCTMRNSSIKSIASEAFSYSGIQDFDFANGLEEIGVRAFVGTSLKEAIFPTSLSYMGESAFQSSSIEIVDLAGVKMTEIPSNAFSYCSNLTTCYMGDSSIVTIGYNAFAQTKLSDIEFSSSLLYIEDNAFYNISTLTTLDLPYSLRSIGYSAFSYCSKLSTVWLRGNLQNIDYYAFEGCPVLYEIYDLCPLSITRGSASNGYVALNAIIVHTSASALPLETQTVNNMTYKYAPTEGEACLFSCSNVPETLNFQAVTLGGKTYNKYWIWKSAFANNSKLKELNTGVVTEIGSYAFANNSELRKVTIGSAIGSGKVGYDSFYGCTKLWEVHDINSYYTISIGSESCGYVAKYAVVLNQNITYKTEKNCDFMYYGGNWYLYKCNLSGNVKLPDVGHNYILFKHQQLSDYPLSGVSYGRYVIIPTSVMQIQNGALGSNYITVYYEGTQSSWNSISYYSNHNASVYYYNECVHNSVKGTRYWRYSNNAPTTSDSALKSVVTAPTCMLTGTDKGVCETCHQVITTDILNKVEHSHTGANGACKWCGKIRVKDGDLGTLVSIENNSLHPFMIDSSGTIYSDWRDDYGYFTSILTLKANKKIDIEFKVRLDSSYSYVYVKVNGITQKTIYSGQQTITLNLNQNDRVSIEFTKSSNIQTQSHVYIENVSIVDKTETTQSGE